MKQLRGEKVSLANKLSAHGSRRENPFTGSPKLWERRARLSGGLKTGRTTTPSLDLVAVVTF